MNSWPQYSPEEISKVSEILKSGNVNYLFGKEGALFEKEFSEYVGTKYSIAVANGTLALELALMAIGIGPGDEVIVPPRSFIATVSSVIRCGATPVFADIDSSNGNIHPKSIRENISSKTKAIIVVHLSGYPCEMDEILETAKLNSLFVIEDCAQAHGAKYKEKFVGSFGDIGCFSFCQDKIISTGGEGGMVTTNNKKLWEKMWSFKDHGKNQKKLNNKGSEPGFKWLHDSIGTNFRMTEMQSAIGRIQLSKLENWISVRTKNSKEIMDTLKDYSNYIELPYVPSYIRHSWYKLMVYVKMEYLPADWTRDRIISELNLLGLNCFSGGCPEIYLEKAIKKEFVPNNRLPFAKDMGERSITFFVHPTLSKEDLKYIKDIIRQVLSRIK